MWQETLSELIWHWSDKTNLDLPDLKETWAMAVTALLQRQPLALVQCGRGYVLSLLGVPAKV